MKSWFVGRPEIIRAPEGPSVPEVVRTRLASASSVRLGVAGGGVEIVRHVVAPDGSLVLVPGEESPVVRQLATGSRTTVPVQLRAVDVAPVALPERVRATVVLAGRLTLLGEELSQDVLEHLGGPGGVWAENAVLRLRPRRVVAILTGAHGAEDPLELDLAAYRAACTDPLVGAEAEWLAHADIHHRDVLAALAGTDVDGVRPVSLDRFGLVLRVEEPVRYERVWFEAPIACACELQKAVDALVSPDTQGFP